MIVRTASQTMAFPIVCARLARRIVSPTMVYMLLLAVLSPAPRRASNCKSLICAKTELSLLVCCVYMEFPLLPASFVSKYSLNCLDDDKS